MLSAEASPVPQTFFHHFDPLHIYDGSQGTPGASIYGFGGGDNIEIHQKDAFFDPYEELGHDRFLSHAPYGHAPRTEETYRTEQQKDSHTNIIITDHHGGNERTTVIQILPEWEQNRPRQLSQDEYLKRLKLMRQELKRLGYGELPAEKYRELILSGGFVHKGQHYVYNFNKEVFIIHNVEAIHANKATTAAPETSTKQAPK